MLYGGGPSAIHTCLPGKAWIERLAAMDILAWNISLNITFNSTVYLQTI